MTMLAAAAAHIARTFEPAPGTLESVTTYASWFVSSLLRGLTQPNFLPN